MKLKKLFAGAASALLVFGTFQPALAALSTDVQLTYASAFGFAVENNLTTMPTLEAFRPLDWLTRWEASFFMVKFMENVLNKVPSNLNSDCEFTDVANYDANLVPSIMKACKYGIMRGSNNQYRPNDAMLRGEFMTALGRVIYGRVHDDKVPFYAGYEQALFEDGYITVLGTANNAALRGNVLVMMQRVSGTDTSSDDDGLGDLADLFGDLLDDSSDDNSDDDSSDDTDGEMKEGTATVENAASQPEDIVPVWVPGVEIASITISAGDESDVMLERICLEAEGFGSAQDLDNVHLVDSNGIKATRDQNVSSDQDVELNFLSNYTIRKGQTERFTILATIDDAASNGDTYGFTVTCLETSSDVDNLPVGTQIVEAVVINDLGVLEFDDTDPADPEVKIGEETEFGSRKVNVKDDDEDVILSALTIFNDGTADSEYFSDLYISVNGEQITEDLVRTNGDYFVFAFKDGGYVFDKDRSSKITFKLMWKISAEVGESINFVIEEAVDVVAYGEKNWFRVPIEDGADAELADDFALTDTNVSVEGAEIIVDFDKSDANSVASEQDEFSFGTLIIESFNSDYLLEEYTINLIVDDEFGVDAAETATQMEDMLRKIRLGGRNYDGSMGGTAGEYTVTFEDINIKKGVRQELELTAEFNDATAGYQFQFDLTFDTDDFKLTDEEDETYTCVSGGCGAWELDASDVLSSTSFDTRVVTVEDAWLNVSIVSLNDDTVVLGNGRKLKVAKWYFEATDTSDVDVTSFCISTNASAVSVTDLNDYVSSATLIVGGVDTYTDTNISTDTIEFDRTFTVEKGTSNRILYEVQVQLKENSDIATAGANDGLEFFLLESCIVAEDEDGNDIDLSAIDEATAYADLNLAEKGTIAVSIDTSEDDETIYTYFTDTDKYVAAGDDMVILAKVEIFADQENSYIEDIYFVAEGTDEDDIRDTVDSMYLLDADFNQVSATSTFTVDGADGLERVLVKFEDLWSQAALITEWSTQYMYVAAKINAINSNVSDGTAVAGTDIAIELRDDTATFDGITYTPRIIGDESGEDLDLGSYTIGAASDSTTVVANVPTNVTLTPKSSLSAGTNIVVAELSVTFDSQSVNRLDDGQLMRAVFSDASTIEINAWGWIDVGSDLTALIRKKGGQTAATTADATIVANLGEESEFGSTVVFEILATDVQFAATSDRSSIQVRIPDIAALGILDGSADLAGATTAVNVGGGLSRDLSVSVSN